MFLRRPQRGGKDGIGQPGSREKEIEFERYRTRKTLAGLSDRGALSLEGKGKCLRKGSSWCACTMENAREREKLAMKKAGAPGPFQVPRFISASCHGV